MLSKPLPDTGAMRMTLPPPGDRGHRSQPVFAAPRRSPAARAGTGQPPDEKEITYELRFTTAQIRWCECGERDDNHRVSRPAADLANRLDNLRLLAGEGLTPAQVRRAQGLLPEAVAARGAGPAVQCHGDLFPGHIFVAMGGDTGVTVTGLIDFGDACGGRPLDDLASLCWEWPEADRAALEAGYGPAPFWNDKGRRLALGRLRMLIGYAAHDFRAGDAAAARGVPGRTQGRARDAGREGGAGSRCGLGEATLRSDKCPLSFCARW